MNATKIGRDGMVTDRESGKMLGWVEKTEWVTSDWRGGVVTEDAWEARRPWDVEVGKFFPVFNTRAEAAAHLAR